MADHLPLYTPGSAVTYKTSAAVTGGRLLEVSGSGTAAHAGAASIKVVGVAGFDAESGGDVTVYAGGIQRIPGSAAITAGAEIASAAGAPSTCAALNANDAFATMRFSRSPSSPSASSSL